MKTYDGVDVYIPVFSTSSLVGSGELQAPASLPQGERAPNTHWIGGWVDPRAGLSDMERRKIMSLVGFELRLLGRSACSWSLFFYLFKLQMGFYPVAVILVQ
jgi:hypothetical protein